jgi:hypothetical protein
MMSGVPLETYWAFKKTLEWWILIQSCILLVFLLSPITEFSAKVDEHKKAVIFLFRWVTVSFPDYRLPRSYVAKDEYAYCNNFYLSVTRDRDAPTFSVLSSSSGSKEGTINSRNVEWHGCKRLWSFQQRRPGNIKFRRDYWTFCVCLHGFSFRTLQ